MTTYRATADGSVSDDSSADINSMLVRIWDLGPEVPVVPTKPELPKGKEGSPEYELAMIDFEGELATYKTALTTYGRMKKEHAEWHGTYHGPYEFETHSVNAREAIQNEPTRYVAELPKGRKAGKWHVDEKQRLADARRTFAQIAARDPVFGNQGAQL